MWYNRTHADIRDKAACASEGKKKGMEKEILVQILHATGR